MSDDELNNIQLLRLEDELKRAEEELEENEGHWRFHRNNGMMASGNIREFMGPPGTREHFNNVVKPLLGEQQELIDELKGNVASLKERIKAIKKPKSSKRKRAKTSTKRKRTERDMTMEEWQNWSMA